MDIDQINLTTRLVETWNENLTQRFLLKFDQDIELNFGFPAKWTILSKNFTYVKHKGDNRMITFLR